MGNIVESLREEIEAEAPSNIFGRKKYPKDGGELYMAARLHDAVNDKKEAEKHAQAARYAALQIIKRFDADGKLHQEFEQLLNDYLTHS